jgi:hypothetical protein
MRGQSRSTIHSLLLRHFPVIAVTLTIVVAACSSSADDRVVGPSPLTSATGADSARKPGRDSTQKPPRDSTQKPPRDTTPKPPRDTVGVDTTPPVPEKVQLSGRVLGVVVIAPAPGVRDTLRFDPVAGMPLRIMRNVLVDGVAKQVLALQLTSDSQGRFSAKDLPGGYYVIYAEPAAGSPWAPSFSYLAATKPDVTVDVYVWKRNGGG